MPTYDYRCNNCLSLTTITRKAEERDNEVLCSYCGLASTRVYSVPSIQFKGTGFYSTDK